MQLEAVGGNSSFSAGKLMSVNGLGHLRGKVMENLFYKLTIDKMNEIRRGNMVSNRGRIVGNTKTGYSNKEGFILSLHSRRF